MEMVCEHRLIWHEYLIEEVSHTSDWCGQIGLHHVSITCLSPDRAALPFTDTGYKAHFLHGDNIMRAGGAVAYVKAWLNNGAKGADWIAKRESDRQRTHF